MSTTYPTSFRKNHPSILGAVHPDFVGQGIGLNWAEARAHQAIERVPNGARVAVHTESLSADEQSNQLYQDNGFQLIRHFPRF